MVNRDIWQQLMMKSKFRKAFSNKDRILKGRGKGGGKREGPGTEGGLAERVVF